MFVAALSLILVPVPLNALARFQQGDQVRAGMDKRGMELRLTTFNLLAPCYKRMHNEAPVPAIADGGTGLLASQAKTHRTARESEFGFLWRERAMETVRLGLRCRIRVSTRFFYS